MFDVDPSQIEDLDSKQLVLLLGRLLHAEAQGAEVPLAGISVPLQITIADGGEDGRIEWQGGLTSTDYLPSRVTHFQCKASAIGRAGWKKECWVKSTQGRGKTRLLTPLLKKLVANGGSYVGFTTEALTSLKIDDCVAAIREGIVDASGDPTRISAIAIYDANKIAEWCKRHPAVATWLAELAHGQSLAGYGTTDIWGHRSDFVATPYVEDVEARFLVGLEKELDRTGADNGITGEAMRLRIMEHVSEPRTSVRVVGSSGLGKSRFVYEALRSNSSPLTAVLASSAVFADYRAVSGSLLGAAAYLAGTGQRIVLIVDECPRDAAIELMKISSLPASGLSVITIDTDPRELEGTGILHVTATKSGGALIEAIIKARNPSIKADVLARLGDMCGGYPRFAVLLAGAPEFKASEFLTVDDIVDRIAKGAGLVADEELRALQALSLFDNLDFDGSAGPTELDVVAEHIARMDGDEMFEHLAKAQAHDLVGRRQNRIAAQPLPVAVNLAGRRLNAIRPSTLWRFMSEQSDELLLSMLRRWRHLDRSAIAIEAAQRLVQRDGRLAQPAQIMTPGGSDLIDALVHLIPDRISHHLEHALLSNDVDTSAVEGDTRRNLVNALEKLVFRAASFDPAARILLKLATTENENYANNATGIFKQLFNLQLSGTEAAPSERFRILDDAIEDGDEATRVVCVEALSNAFNQFPLRFGSADQIGSGPPLIDWAPTTWDELNDFYRQALDRLQEFRTKLPELAQRCEAIMAGATRFMLSSQMYREFGECLMAIAAEKGWWPEAVEGVGDWLYFDRPGQPPEQQAYIRELYDRLFPSSAIERAVLYTKFWGSDIRDPDVVYSEKKSDFGYSERAARRMATEISSNTDLAIEAIRTMGRMDLKGVLSFAEQLAIDIGKQDRRMAFEAALELLDDPKENLGTGMLRGLLRGIDATDHDLADELLAEAKGRMGARPLIDLYTSLSIDAQRLSLVIEDLKAGRMYPAQTIFLSYGQGLDGLPEDEVAGLLFELASSGPDGVWAALEISMMYKLGAEIGQVHAASISALIVHPSLLQKSSSRQREAHTLESSIERVRSRIGADPELADGLCLQLRRFIQVEDGNLFRDLLKAMRLVVGFLKVDAPKKLWSQIATTYDAATPIERGRLTQVIGAAQKFFDGTPQSGPGPLFGLPEDMMFSWVDGNKDRIELLVSFYPLLADETGTQAWHAALLRLADRYGDSPAFMAALARRIHPRSWSGSIVPLLEAYLKPIESLFGSSSRKLSGWARDQHKSILRRIESEKADDTERGI